MNELREQFFGLIKELGITSIDRWVESRKFRRKEYKTYYIRCIIGDKEYVMSMDEYTPTYRLMNSDRTFTLLLCCRFEFFEKELRRKCNR